MCPSNRLTAEATAHLQRIICLTQAAAEPSPLQGAYVSLLRTEVQSFVSTDVRQCRLETSLLTESFATLIERLGDCQQRFATLAPAYASPAESMRLLTASFLPPTSSPNLPILCCDEAVVQSLSAEVPLLPSKPSPYEPLSEGSVPSPASPGEVHSFVTSVSPAQESGSQSELWTAADPPFYFLPDWCRSVATEGSDATPQDAGVDALPRLAQLVDLIQTVETDHDALNAIGSILSTSGWEVQHCRCSSSTPSRFSPLSLHCFLAVKPPTLLERTPQIDPPYYVIDTSFKALFDVARPSPTFKDFLHHLRPTFVGTFADLERSIDFISAHVSSSLSQAGMRVPPWRRPAHLKDVFQRGIHAGADCPQYFADASPELARLLAENHAHLKEIGFVVPHMSPRFAEAQQLQDSSAERSPACRDEADFEEDAEVISLLGNAEVQDPHSVSCVTEDQQCTDEESINSEDVLASKLSEVLELDAELGVLEHQSELTLLLRQYRPSESPACRTWSLGASA
eukprot:TRINITY_DN12565_c0_g1_i1.p1 TRINITY_DN12565_c0_g1~~TRINITY_DN12565_c0_g1_i1.p1  ORF type:complete len:513 (-),score=65.22 TRINITY_DN12565_c0_g1_i1:371-1909(-)